MSSFPSLRDQKRGTPAEIKRTNRPRRPEKLERLSRQLAWFQNKLTGYAISNFSQTTAALYGSSMGAFNWITRYFNKDENWKIDKARGKIRRNGVLKDRGSLSGDSSNLFMANCLRGISRCKLMKSPPSEAITNWSRRTRSSFRD